MQYDVVVIGAGVVGAMITRELSKYNLNLMLVEKCSDVAIINGEEWFQNWQKDKKTGQWSITVTPKNNAPLYLAIQLHRNGDYWPCLEYVVK